MSDKNNRVLIVEGDESMRSLCESILRRGHYEVMAAPDVARGVEIAAEFNPHVVLSGIMPKGDFDDFTRQLDNNETRPKMLAYMHDIKQMADNTRICRGLELPFKPIDLLCAVEGVVYGAVSVCVSCLNDYRKGARQDVFYQSKNKFGEHAVWYTDTTKPVDSLTLSHGMCPPHFKELYGDLF